MKLFYKQPKPAPQPIGTYYTSIHKLPLSRFVDALIDGDLKALVISGEPLESDLQKAWDDILLQYGDALESPQQIIYIKKQAELTRRTFAYNVSVALISILKLAYVEEFARRLNLLLSTAFGFDTADKEKYLHKLKQCNTRLKNHKVRIDLLELEIEALLEKYGKDLQPPTREDFQRSIITLSDYAGRELDENTLTVFSYCERLRRFNKWAQQKEKESKKQHSVTR